MSDKVKNETCHNPQIGDYFPTAELPTYSMVSPSPGLDGDVGPKWWKTTQMAVWQGERELRGGGVMR